MNKLTKLYAVKLKVLPSNSTSNYYDTVYVATDAGIADALARVTPETGYHSFEVLSVADMGSVQVLPK